MPVILRAAPADGHDTLTLDIVETQCLIRMDGEGAVHYWAHILLVRLRKALWITYDPNLDIVVDNLAQEEVVPVN